MFWGYIPLHSPYIGLIYGRYLQFGFVNYLVGQSWMDTWVYYAIMLSYFSINEYIYIDIMIYIYICIYTYIYKPAQKAILCSESKVVDSVCCLCHHPIIYHQNSMPYISQSKLQAFIRIRDVRRGGFRNRRIPWWYPPVSSNVATETHPFMDDFASTPPCVQCEAPVR